MQYVAVLVGDDVAAAKKVAEERQLPFLMLLDADRALFKQLVKLPNSEEPGSQLPRVYLLDSHGKVLWFSLDYSIAAQRELGIAIEYLRLKRPE